MQPDEQQKAPTSPETFWIRTARRWSGRGRIRNVFFWIALIFSNPNTNSMLAGFAVFTFGVLLHVIAKGHLVRNTQLCTDGPYGWVRHPFYLANLFVDSGLWMIAGVPWLTAIYVLAFPLAYLPRLFAEEEVLSARFGDQFLNYRRDTPALFPRRLPHMFNWVLDISYENLRLENELSRLVRLLSYPFLIVAVLLAKESYLTGSGWTSPHLIGSTATAISLWVVAAVLHRFVEDGHARNSWQALSTLRYLWLLLPVACLTGVCTSHGHENSVFRVIGGVAIVASAITWLVTKVEPIRNGFAQPVAALGSALLCEQIVVAPLLALLIWLSYFFDTKARTVVDPASGHLEGSSRRNYSLQVIAFILFLLCMLFHESYGHSF